MLKNYLKIIFRGFLKNKHITLINLIGLTSGITCITFLYLYLFNELSYDKYHLNADKLYRIITKYGHNKEEYCSTRTPAPLAYALKTDVPGIEQTARLRVMNNVIVQTDRYSFKEKLVMGGDPSTFELFTFPFVKGAKKNALVEPNTVIITQSIADKYFGQTDPINKQIKLNISNVNFLFTITGVIDNIPGNSHFHFHLLVSNSTFEESKGPWNSGFGVTYFLLKTGASINDVESNLKGLMKKYLPDETEEPHNNQYLVQKVTDIHLYSNCRKELENNGSILNIYIFSALAILILIVTCINYINLSTAKYEQRTKEIGLRKMFGANSWSHIKQFLLDSAILCTISFLVALILVESLLNLFKNNLYNLNGNNVLYDVYVFPGLLIFTFLLSLLSGLYPAIYFIPTQITELFKNKYKTGQTKVSIRNVLTVLQIIICMGVIMFNLIIYKQNEYIQVLTTSSFDKDNILIINNIKQLKETAGILKEELAKYNKITGVTLCSQLPCKEEVPQTSCLVNGNPKYIDVKVIACDDNYLNTLKIKNVKEGRFFDPSFASDSDAVVINEKTVEELGIINPIGKVLRFNGRNKTIIGIINNFYFEPVFKEIEPLCMIMPTYYSYRPVYLALKLKSSDVKEVLEYVQSKWKSHSADIPFEYSFLNDDFLKTYESVDQIRKLAFTFLIIIVMTSNLGLFGLIMYLTQKRTKEIGIRKVNGASFIEILILLIKSVAKWVIIAFIISCPIAYYVMFKWLENFAYKTEISWWVFLVAGAGAGAVALITVSWQSWRAASRNPVEALRYE